MQPVLEKDPDKPAKRSGQKYYHIIFKNDNDSQ